MIINIEPYAGTIDTSVEFMKKYGRGFKLFQDIWIEEGAAWIIGVSMSIDHEKCLPVIQKGGKLYTTIEYASNGVKKC